MDLPSTGCILLDSGDGSLSVMIRRFGLEGTFERLRRLKLVWISNTDVDYHAGLIEILKLHGNLVDIFNFKRFTHPLVLLAPMPLLRVLLRLPHFQFRKFKYADCFQTEKLELSLLGVTYMNACKKKWKKYAMLNSQSCFDWRVFYHEIQNSSFGIRNQYEKHIIKKIPLKTKVSLLNNLLPTQDFSKQQMVLEIENLLGSICITSVRTVPDPHSFGCILESKKGWKLVYSGASWSCPQLMKSVKGATLFINKVEFKEKKVFEKLIPLSNQLEVFCTLVFEFFQRFDKLNEFIKKIQTWCCIASDMIIIRIQDLPTFLFILSFVRSCLGF
jgi:ribonuclease BN (tRNA processing enzyme)